MNIVSISKVNQDAAELFAEHDDYLIEFLGEDRKYYTRYSNNENLENIWVAYSENVPAGCIAYRKKADSVGEIKRLYVRSGYRGKRLSKELIKTAQDYAKEKGCKTMFLDTRITLEPAVSIYRSCGYDIVFQQGLYIQMEKKI